MPKEYINSEQHGVTALFHPDVIEGDDGSAVPVSSRVVDHDAIKVSWSKEAGHVQLAILDRDADPDGFDARHISINRSGINRLIKVLRRARDDSFGADE